MRAVPPATKRAPASPRQSTCCACHAKVPLDALSAAPATQMHAVPPATKCAPASPRQSKCCTCHAKVPRDAHHDVPDSQSAAPATQMRAVPPATKRATGKSQTVKVLRLPRKCARSLRRPNAHRQVPDSQSAAPATQKYREMHRVLRLPRKCARSLRRPNAHRQVPDSQSMSTCCACHAKVPLDALSAAPATQMHAVPPATKCAPASPRQSKCLHLPRKSTREMPQSAASATQVRAVPSGDQTRTGKSQTVKVLRLPRKSSARGHRVLRLPRKCARSLRATKRAPASPTVKVLRLPRKCARSLPPGDQTRTRQVPDSQSAAPATQMHAVPPATKRAPASPRQSKCCACHAKVLVPRDTQSAAPATQMRAVPPATKRAPASPRQSKCCACHAKVPRRCRQSKCCVCHANACGPSGDQTRTGKSQTVKVLRLPRKSSARYTECCACHANARV